MNSLHRLNHPVKKFKSDAKDNQHNSRMGKDLYSMFSSNGIMSGDDSINSFNMKCQSFIKQEIKQEPICQVI